VLTLLAAAHPELELDLNFNDRHVRPDVPPGPPLPEPSSHGRNASDASYLMPTIDQRSKRAGRAGC
jgi:hypothetical protein